MARGIKNALALALIASLSLAGSMASAAQKKIVDADGSVKFVLSTKSVTRISINDDRIRRVVNDNSQFELTSDEKTGDVFLRFSGDDTEADESGYIVTENGHTISYTLSYTERHVEPVIITIKQNNVKKEEVFLGGGNRASFSDSVALSMISIVKEVINSNIIGRTPPRSSHNRVLKRENGDGWSATIRVASGGKAGRLIREQDFYRNGVLAVWVQKNALAANERTFVVVVEDR